MQYFLREENVAPTIQREYDYSVLEEIELDDKPLYQERIDINGLTNRGKNSYTKDDIQKILLQLFGHKNLPGGQKSEAIKFILLPENLARVKYNNELYDREQATKAKLQQRK